TMSHAKLTARMRHIPHRPRHINRTPNPPYPPPLAKINPIQIHAHLLALKHHVDPRIILLLGLGPGARVVADGAAPRAVHDAVGVARHEAAVLAEAGAVAVERKVADGAVGGGEGGVAEADGDAFGVAGHWEFGESGDGEEE